MNKTKHAARKKKPLFPWLGALYAFCALALIPWVVRLGTVIPHRTVSPHWQSAWVGLDVMLIVMLALSAIMLLVHSAWAIMTTSIVGGMLVLDAWFDLLTAHRGHEFTLALASALCIEVPLAALSFWVAVHAIRELDALPKARRQVRARLNQRKMVE
ncbi:MAG TPA: hypothetical protein VJP80_06740 [Candidatus Saccharimonadales bacterium]|nr:hypothetical protein [Candidatus Saccharimonadales bacterium]